MDELTTLEIDFNDYWRSSSGQLGWLCYEPSKVTTGQHFLAVDAYDATLTARVSVAGTTKYVAFLMPTILPAETSDESSL